MSATAIRLTETNLVKIANRADLPAHKVYDMLVNAQSLGEKRIIVFDASYAGSIQKWLNYREDAFFEIYDFIDEARTDKICQA